MVASDDISFKFSLTFSFAMASSGIASDDPSSVDISSSPTGTLKNSEVAELVEEGRDVGGSFFVSPIEAWTVGASSIP